MCSGHKPGELIACDDPKCSQFYNSFCASDMEGRFYNSTQNVSASGLQCLPLNSTCQSGPETKSPFGPYCRISSNMTDLCEAPVCKDIPGHSIILDLATSPKMFYLNKLIKKGNASKSFYFSIR